MQIDIALISRLIYFWLQTFQHTALPGTFCSNQGGSYYYLFVYLFYKLYINLPKQCS